MEIKKIEHDYKEKHGSNFDISVFLKDSHPFNNAVYKFNIKYEKHRPFIPEDIFSYAEKITEISAIIFANRIVAPLQLKINVLDEFRNSIEEMDKIIDELSNLIRKRIRITEEI